jgi:hypothetical protein
MPGMGLFATELIPAGAPIMTFGGDTVSRDEAYSGKYLSRSIWPISQDEYTALPLTETEPTMDEALNHACDASAWLEGACRVVARRDILPGEEVTLDQGTWNFEDDSFVDDNALCTCGSVVCRGALTKEDWKRADVQARYAWHFHPVVTEMIASENERSKRR